MKVACFKELKEGVIFAYPFNDGIEIYYKLKNNKAIFLADDWDDKWEGDYFSKEIPPYPTLVKPGDILHFGNWWVTYKLDKRIQDRWLTTSKT